jgi:hypothetical protein
MRKVTFFGSQSGFECGKNGSSKLGRRRRAGLPIRWEGLEHRVLLSGSAATWTGSAGNGLWSDAGNWQGNAVPTAGQNVEFDNLTGSGNPQIVQVDQAVEVGSLTIDNTILQGTSAITLDGDVTCGTSNYVTILDPVVLTHNTTLTVTNGTGGKFSDLQFSGGISDGGHGYGLTVTGGGEVDIVPTSIQNGNAAYVNANVTTSYTGATAANDGSILTANISGPTALDLSGGTQFFGSGSVASVDATGTGTQFGASDLLNFNPDVMTISNSLRLGTGTTFVDTINGSKLGNGTTSTGFSEVDVKAGVINLGGATLSAELKTSVYTPKAEDVITLIKNETGHAIVGTFAGLAQGSQVKLNGYDFTISYHGGSSGKDVTLTYPTTPVISAISGKVASSHKSATLSATATDPGGKTLTKSLTYTWTLAKKPNGAKAPTFSANGTHAASVVLTHLYKAGTYEFRCTVTNSQGGTSERLLKLVVA